MLKPHLITLLMLLAYMAGLQAQCTTEPTPLQEDSKNVVVFFHADQGNKGLINQPASAQIYAHTGVLTSKSSGSGDWKYAPSWGDNSPKYKLEYVSPNLWKLNIGDIRTYYGITDPAETVKKLAFVFRTGDKSKEGKAEGGGDIFVDVVDSGLQIALESNIPGSVVTITTVNAHFKAGCTRPSNLSISVNGKEIASVANATVVEADYTFPGPGDYKVTAKAVADGETVETSNSYCFARDSGPSSLTVAPPMGVTRNADGSVTFCLAAPQKQSVILVGSWNDYLVSNDHVMDYIDDAATGARYFVTTVKNLDKSKTYMYYYYVDATYQVGDPYARLVLDPSYDKYIPADVFPNLPEYPSGKVSGAPLAVLMPESAYDWKVKNFKGADKSNLVIYELLFRDFTGTEGKADGNGTVRKAIAKIPYLKSLGVNVVELLPITEFNGNLSWGYNPNFYFAPDKAYGTPDDYKEFIDICHQEGIAVVLDMVFNQTDWMHPWYQMYQVGQNPFYNATAPHAYSVLNDWNQGYPLVEQQWKDAVKYWMEEYKVDGYRFDLVKGLGNNDSYANSTDGATNAYNQSRIDRMKRIHDVMREVNPDAYFINENLAGAQEENAMAKDGELNWANLNTAGCQYAMGLASNSNLNRMYAPYDSRDWGSTVAYLESHDEQRLAYRQQQSGQTGIKGNVKSSMQRLGSAAAQMILAPGSHMIWQFSEMGNAENTKDNSNGNNTSNKIVNWNLMDEPNHKGLVDCYRELIHIRLGNPELFAQDAAFSMECNVNNWANGRTMISTSGDKQLITVINPNIAGQVVVKVPFAKADNSAYTIMSKSYDSTPTFSAVNGSVAVPANCYVTIGMNVSSAVREIASDAENLKVEVVDGGLRVVNATSPVNVFDLSGICVARDNGENLISLAPGIYIVRCGSETLKVAVSR